MNRRLAYGIVCGACLAGSFQSRAQDCGLLVRAHPKVLHHGERAAVDVLAYFDSSAPAPAHYALAAAAFDVFSSSPAWTFVTGGAIAGNDVLGIIASQPHAPQAGVFADPSNPIRIWNGMMTAVGYAAALVEVKAEPTVILVYPSKLTSSYVQCDPSGMAGSSDLMMVNPIRAGEWRAAPGRGTSTTVDDVIVDGRIITGESMSIGLMYTADDLKESNVRVQHFGRAATFTATVWAVNPEHSTPISTISMNFTRLESDQGWYRIDARGSEGAGVGFSPFNAYIGGVRVAGGNAGNDLLIGGLPDNIVAKSGGGVIEMNTNNTYTGTTMVLMFDRPLQVVYTGPDGRPRHITADRIEVATPISEASARVRGMNNLKQLSLGVHVFEATGVSRMRLKPEAR